MTAPVLHMLAAPIGNLEDISLRALRLLREATTVAAEDTRVARRLLTALNIPLPQQLLSLRAHNERQAAEALSRAVLAGDSVVYLPDAGTPAISDPGARLVRALRETGIAVVPVPGASALTALLAVAGLPAELPQGAVHFYGFPPAAAARRRRFFDSLHALDGYSVFYESPHRIVAAVADLRASFGDARRVVLGRELTKLHEQVVDDTLAGLAAALDDGGVPVRGEFALAVENPAVNAAAADGWRVFCELVALLPPRKAAAAAAKITGADSGVLYRRYVAGGGEDTGR